MESDTRPAIFYAPHPDDEAIAMAGAIRRHKEEGRPVYLVLLTNGINRSLLNILNGSLECAWHRTHHNFQLTMEQMCWARRIEFVASARRLDVDAVFIINDGRGLDPAMCYNDLVSCVKRTIARFGRKFPRASHHLVSGKLDLLQRDGGMGTNSSHQACWDAAMKLGRGISDFYFYRVYVYGKDRGVRESQYQQDLKPEWQASKRAALDEYKLFCPEAGRFAVGYHSVPQLFDAAATDSKEYLDLLPKARGVWTRIRQLMVSAGDRKPKASAS